MDVKVDASRIRSERENRGWTQGHLASVAGLSLRTIQRIEKTGSASFESVTALASVLSVDVAELRASEIGPSGERAIRLSLELPLRLALAVASGVLVALHFLWATVSGWGVDRGWLDDDWLHYALAGALFGLAVLCPYLRSGKALMLRALALVGASSLSYFCAVWTLSTEEWFSVAPVLSSFLLASLVGLTIVLVTAKILIPLRVTAAYWFLGLVASLVGGAGMYAGIEIFDATALSTVVGYCCWHVLACIAIDRGQQSNDARAGWLAAFMTARGRFRIVPGWMSLSHVDPNMYRAHRPRAVIGAGVVPRLNT